LGISITAEEVIDCLTKAGCRATCTDSAAGTIVTIKPPVFRNDFLHPVDIVEEIMIGKSMNAFEPVMPRDFTVGRLSPAERFARKIKSIMVGSGYQEMIYNYLGAGRDFLERMGTPESPIVRIGNPMSESFEFVRNSILPCLLASESVSGNAVYPHRIFEVGKIVVPDPTENYGTSTRNYLGFLAADKLAGFNEVNAHLSALMYYISISCVLTETEDARFISGRAAEVFVQGKKAGIIGEIHPDVLTNWGIGMPCAGGEVDLDVLLAQGGN